MSEPTEHLYPTRHGNWHVIDGKLVDVPLEPVVEAANFEPPASQPHQPRPRRFAPED